MCESVPKYNLGTREIFFKPLRKSSASGRTSQPFARFYDLCIKKGLNNSAPTNCFMTSLSIFLLYGSMIFFHPYEKIFIPHIKKMR